MAPEEGNGPRRRGGPPYIGSVYGRTTPANNSQKEQLPLCTVEGTLVSSWAFFCFGFWNPYIDTGRKKGPAVHEGRSKIRHEGCRRPIH